MTGPLILPGQHRIVRPLHPEYSVPTYIMEARCIDCGRVFGMAGCDVIEEPWRCIGCIQNLLQREGNRRLAQGLCAHCGHRWDDVEGYSESLFLKAAP